MVNQSSCFLRSVIVSKKLFHQKNLINCFMKRNKAYFKIQPQEYLDGIAKKSNHYTEVERNKFIKHRVRPFIPHFEADILKFSDNIYLFYIAYALFIIYFGYKPFEQKKINEKNVVEYYCPPEENEPIVFKDYKIFY